MPRPRSKKNGQSPLKFGTSGWRAVMADEFTFGNVWLAATAIADHVRSKNRKPSVIVGHDTRFFSPEFARTAAAALASRKVRVLLCAAATPTPAIANEILRRKCSGAINVTASHNPAAYNGLKFSGPDGGPALPEVTRDVEAHIAKLARRPQMEGLASLPVPPAELFESLPPGAEDDVWALSNAERRAMGIEPLPQNLGEALTLMENSDLVAETLGEHVFDFFLRNKKSEWEEYRSEVTAFELRKNLPVL